jgi:hypothetical protein
MYCHSWFLILHYIKKYDGHQSHLAPNFTSLLHRANENLSVITHFQFFFFENQLLIEMKIKELMWST